MPYNGNRECFALQQDFEPAEAVVETCSTTTWIQLNLHLLELTGLARYAAEAERAVFNALMAAQYQEGIDWCYYTRANENRREYSPKIKCCASSGPRALEMFARHMIGAVDGGISLASLVPCSAILPQACGKARIKVTGNYPCSPRVGIRFEEAGGKDFALEFRDPADARLTAARINGEDIALQKNHRGFYRINRAWKSGDAIDIDFEYLLIRINLRDQEFPNLPLDPSSFAPLRLCASPKNFFAQRRKGAKFFRIKISRFGARRYIGDYHIPNA